MAALTVTMTDDPAVAVDQARRYLESRPVDHNLVLSLLHDRAAREEGQRIYRLGELRLAAGVPGALRRATRRDRDLLVAWRVAFCAETEAPGSGDPAAAVERDVIAGRMFVWDDEGPACVARATVPVAGVSRIGGVYTPPGLRRRGYASGCVGSLCSWVRQEDRATCILYAQLANPTSNAIYRRLGFEAVAEVLSYRFRPGSHSRRWLDGLAP